ncbi:hypothetical protein ACFFWC_01565 [Plantactinospora siamensis]|uniref:Uncharacterized protein n=1 Tax=Plantactinospora siamensis TaxID=555372 RepID=A0ABV6NV71_9ACTN
MQESGGTPMDGTTTDPAAIAAEVRRMRERVRADRRTVTAPLVVFGALIVVHAALSVLVGLLTGAAARHSALLAYWPLAGAAGLAALWAHARRLAAREGVGGGPRSYRPVTLGYVVSLPLLALLFVPALLLGVFAPLVWPAAVLAAVAVRQRSARLRSVAKWLAVAGAAQGLLALVEAALGVGAAWAVLGLDAGLGLGLMFGALRTTRRGAVHGNGTAAVDGTGSPGMDGYGSAGTARPGSVA